MREALNELGTFRYFVSNFFSLSERFTADDNIKGLTLELINFI